MLIMIGGAIGSLGAPAVIFLILWLTPMQPFGLEAWRWALIIGAMGSAAVGALFQLLPESPRWLAAAGRHAEAEAVCRRFERSAGIVPADRALIASNADAKPHAPGPADHQEKQLFWSAAGRQHRLRAVLLGALYFLSPWATIGFPLLSGAVLIEKGFRVADSLLYLGVAMFGPAVGAVAAALVIDRIERRTALVLCGAAMAIFGLGFAASATPAPLIAFGLAFNLVAAIYIGALGIYGAELFPTGLRAAASASAFAVNRVASALVPLALLPLLKGGGPMAMLSVVAAVLVGSAALVLTFGPPGLARQPVQ